MKIVDYRIIEAVPFKENGKIGFRLLVRCNRAKDSRSGYRLEHKDPTEFDVGIELCVNHPSWNRIRLVKDSESQFVRIAAYNHDNLYYGVSDHEIREVYLSRELFSHFESTQEDPCQLSK